MTITTTSIARRVARLEKMMPPPSQSQSQQDQRRRNESTQRERAAILEISNTPTEWSSSVIKDRITEALRRLQKNLDFENPEYAGAMLIREVVAAFNDLPDLQAYVVRVFTARGVMPGPDVRAGS